MNAIRVLGGPGTEEITPTTNGRITWMGSVDTTIDLLLQVRSLAADVIVLMSVKSGASVSQLLDEYPDVKVLVISDQGDVILHHRNPSNPLLGKWKPAVAADLIEQVYEANKTGSADAIH